jgi:hypothetical protein
MGEFRARAPRLAAGEHRLIETGRLPQWDVVKYCFYEPWLTFSLALLTDSADASALKPSDFG